MTNLRILGQKKVGTVKNTVKAALGVDIKIYDQTGAEASDEVTLGSIRTKRPEQVEVRVVGQTLVKNVIKFFGSNYGIEVEILSGDGTVADIHTTLGAVKKTYFKELNVAVQNSMRTKGAKMSEEMGKELVWHIDRAKFSFDDADDYEEWKKDKKVFFEFSPSQSDDSGESVFIDASECEDDFEVTSERGKVSISLEDDGPVVSAWVKVRAELVEDLDEEILSEWSSDQGGWASCSIYLGPYDASITEDDGGDWRFA